MMLNRVEYAYKVVSKFSDDKLPLVIKLPALIQQNGLYLTLAYLSKKEKIDLFHRWGNNDEYKYSSTIFYAIVSYLQSLGFFINKNDFFTQKCSTLNYMQMTQEVFNLSIWLKVFAESRKN